MLDVVFSHYAFAIKCFYFSFEKRIWWKTVLLFLYVLLSS